MLTIEEAQERILAAITTLPTVRLPLQKSLGLALAEPAVTSEPIPTFANSVMDGYAVRAEDLQDASPDSPVYLTVVGEAPAGYETALAVQPGEAVAIYTGAPIPDGANAVVMHEDARPAGELVEVTEPIQRSDNVRPAGNDVAAGVQVLKRGSTLTPAALAMLAAMGRTNASAHRRARVAILSTGDELTPPGQTLRPAHIYDANSISLAAQIEQAGAEVVASVHVRDQAAALETALRDLPPCDAIVSSGGVSVADYDFVKDVVGRNGQVEFWSVAIKPGRPLAFGNYTGTPYFGLSGNPVSSYVTFELYVRPALRKMMGFTNVHRPVMPALLEETITHDLGRREYMRALCQFTDDGPTVRVVGDQGSAVLSALAQANCLLIMPEDEDTIPAGETVDVMLLHLDA